MKTEWIPTHDYYHRIIETVNDGERRALYRDLFIAPWQSLIARIQSMSGSEAQDEFAAARALNWLGPEDLRDTPAALRALEEADAWTIGATALAEGAARFAPYADRLPFDTITGWLMLADPQRSDPIMRGYTGGIDWPNPRFICQYDTPNDYNLPRLPGLVVHEMHHLIRLAVHPWSQYTRVADYIILEGLAESFAAALYGADVVGYYVTDFDAAELETARTVVGRGLQESGFDVIRTYIFGDHWAQKLGLPQRGVPTYGGYAIGYHVVQAFLDRTGQSVEEATFLPADDIVAGSGFFS